MADSKFVPILSKISFWKKKLCKNTSVKTNESVTFEIYFALITKENSSKDVSVTYFQNMLIWNKLLLHWKLKELLHPIVISQRNWFRRKTGFAEKLVSQWNWFLVALAKIFVIILAVKQITYNAKLSETTILRFF